MRRSILASAFLSVLFSLLVISCSSHDSSTSTTSESSDALTALAAIAVPASDTMTIGNYVLVSKVRYGRTAYDYTFRVSMSNSGSQYAQDVRAVLFSSVQTTVVISGTLDFGDIAPGETVQSQNTFTVRIDRLYTFNESDLIWEIQAAFPEAVGMIDSSGGTVEVTDPQSSLNGTVISLPAGALTENKNISIKETYLSSSLPHEVVNAGPIVDLGPDGMQFTQPVEVTLPYDDKDNDGIIDNCDVPEDQISVITFNTTSGAWENVQIISQDTQNNTVTIFVEHFSLYTTAAPSKSSDKNVIIFVVDGLKFEQLKRRAFSYALSSGKYFGWEAAILSACLKEWVDRKIETYSRPSYLEEALESKDVGLELLKSDIKFFDGSSQASTETEKAWNGDSEETPTLVKNLREALKDEWDRRGDKKFIIVSHSWGTVLSSLALAYEDQIKPDLMITLSSPFGTDNVSCDLSTTDELWSDAINLYTNWKVSATQYDLGMPSRSLFQSGTADEWINYWAYGDLMSGPLNAAGIADDDTIDPQETAQADERNQDTTHVWHAVTSLSKEMMDEKDDYNPSGESIYEEFGKPFIEKVKQQLQNVIGYLEHATYEIIDLGHLGGGSSHIDRSGGCSVINNKGQVVGDSRRIDGNTHAFLYSNGIMTDLGTLPGATYSAATGINDNGQIVGWCLYDEPNTYGNPIDKRRAFLYTDGTMVDLGTLPGGDFSEACDINDNGQIVGFSNNASDGQRHAFLYNHGEMIDLHTLLGGGLFSIASSINNNSQIACCSSINGWFKFSIYYDDNTITDLGSKYNIININDLGQGVGYSISYVSANSNHALLYRDGIIYDLGTLPGDIISHAYGINNNGQVVGSSSDGQGNIHPFIYSDGVMTDLTTLIDPNQGWTIRAAYGINDKGQIVGGGIHNGKSRVFLMTPVSTSTGSSASGGSYTEVLP